jgi:hypothetical protein
MVCFVWLLFYEEREKKEGELLTSLGDFNAFV